MQKYGYTSIPALIAMMEDDRRNMLYQDYTATMLRQLTQAFISFAGGKYDAPSFIEMVYPEQRQPKQTKQEIIDHVLALFSE